MLKKIKDWSLFVVIKVGFANNFNSFPLQQLMKFNKVSRKINAFCKLIERATRSFTITSLTEVLYWDSLNKAIIDYAGHKELVLLAR